MELVFFFFGVEGVGGLKRFLFFLLDFGWFGLKENILTIKGLAMMIGQNKDRVVVVGIWALRSREVAKFSYVAVQNVS